MGKDDNEKESENLCITCDDIIKGYQVNEKIDEGNFGQVFRVSKNGKRYAMKIEPNRLDGGSSAIKMEIEILSDLQAKNVNFVPKFIGGGKELKYQWVVMELLSDNLKKLRLKCEDPNVCSTGTWSRIGIQCLYIVKTLHDNGIVHRDLKPANFAMGPPESVLGRVLHVLDFGISRRFVLRKKERISPDTSAMKKPEFEFRLARRRTHSFKGTPVYASPNAHALLDLGRVDDVWSLMYLIAELVQPLPWALLEDQELEKVKKASKLKDLFKNESFNAVEQMLQKNNFYSCPNYELVYKTLKAVYDKSRRSWLDPFDWETEQLGSYQKWRKMADSRMSLFPWEYSDVSTFFRYDPWSYLQEARFQPGAQEIPTLKKKKIGRNKKEGDTITAEAMTIEEARTPIVSKRKSSTTTKLARRGVPR